MMLVICSAPREKKTHISTSDLWDHFLRQVFKSYLNDVNKVSKFILTVNRLKGGEWQHVQMLFRQRCQKNGGWGDSEMRHTRKHDVSACAGSLSLLNSLQQSWTCVIHSLQLLSVHCSDSLWLNVISQNQITVPAESTMWFLLQKTVVDARHGAFLTSERLVSLTA